MEGNISSPGLWMSNYNCLSFIHVFSISHHIANVDIPQCEKRTIEISMILRHQPSTKKALSEFHNSMTLTCASFIHIPNVLISSVFLFTLLSPPPFFLLSYSTLINCCFLHSFMHSFYFCADRMIFL